MTLVIRILENICAVANWYIYICMYVFKCIVQADLGEEKKKGRYEQFKLSWTWSYYIKTHTLKSVHFGSELSVNENIEENKTINRSQCLWSCLKETAFSTTGAWSTFLPLALLDRELSSAHGVGRHPRGWLQWRKCWTEVQLTEIRSLRSPDNASPSSVLVLHCWPGAEI